MTKTRDKQYKCKMVYFSKSAKLFCTFLLIWQTRTALSALSDCHSLLKNFAKVVSNFTFCAVSNSRPFRFCCHCEDVYVDTLNRHKDIVDKEVCHSDLIMAEKYQLVESAYNFVVDLWKTSNCPQCFDKGKGGRPNGIKREIKKFFQKLDAVEHCFFNNSEIHIIPLPINHSRANSSNVVKNGLCDNCKKVYNILEESYKNITGSDSLQYKVCADLSAAMNYTRQRWSKDFHCVKIHRDLVSVVALTVFFCFLPIIFYSSVKLQGASNNRKPGASLRANQS